MEQIGGGGQGKEKGECDEKGEQKPYIQFSLFLKFRFSKTRDMILSGKFRFGKMNLATVPLLSMEQMEHISFHLH